MKALFGIIGAVASAVVGAEHAEGSLVALQFGDAAYHVSNLVMGFFFGVGIVTFLTTVSQVLGVAGVFAKWFVAASFSILVSGIYLTAQFYRIFVMN